MNISEIFNTLFRKSPRCIFYVYDHWGPGARLVIHKSDCKFCNDGSGLFNKKDSENGRWVGPFKNIRKAEKFASNFGRRVDKCKFCIAEDES